MQKNLPNFDILKKFKTLKDIEELSSQIENTLSDLYKVKKGRYSEVLDKNTGEENIRILKKIAKDRNMSLSDHALLEKLLKEIKQELSKARVLNLYLAIDPTSETAENISSWVKKNLGEDVVLNIEKDESILGGAIISFNGNYKDFSLRKSLDEILRNRKDEIFSLVK